MNTPLVPAVIEPSSRTLELPHAAAAPATPHRLTDLEDLVQGFLLSKRSVNTREAYAADIGSWISWCQQINLAPLAAGIHHADAYLRVIAECGDPRTGRTLSAASIARRTAALHGFYTYTVRQAAAVASPFAGIERPAVDDESVSVSLSRDEVRQLLEVAYNDSPRSYALMALLVLNGVRISEALNASVTDLGYDSGHRVLRITRKGGRRSKTPLTPDVQVAIDAAIAGRADGPIFATSTGKALDRTAAWRLMRRLATKAGINSADRLSPHSMRHTFATTALDAGVPLRDVQDSMGHKDPRTTRLYDRSRDNLTRNATYAVAAALSPERP